MSLSNIFHKLPITKPEEMFESEIPMQPTEGQVRGKQTYEMKPLEQSDEFFKPPEQIAKDPYKEVDRGMANPFTKLEGTSDQPWGWFSKGKEGEGLYRGRDWCGATIIIVATGVVLTLVQLLG